MRQAVWQYITAVSLETVKQFTRGAEDTLSDKKTRQRLAWSRPQDGEVTPSPIFEPDQASRLIRYKSIVKVVTTLTILFTQAARPQRTSKSFLPFNHPPLRMPKAAPATAVSDTGRPRRTVQLPSRYRQSCGPPMLPTGPLPIPTGVAVCRRNPPNTQQVAQDDGNSEMNRVKSEHNSPSGEFSNSPSQL